MSHVDIAAMTSFHTTKCCHLASQDKCLRCLCSSIHQFVLVKALIWCLGNFFKKLALLWFLKHNWIITTTSEKFYTENSPKNTSVFKKYQCVVAMFLFNTELSPSQPHIWSFWWQTGLDWV